MRSIISTLALFLTCTFAQAQAVPPAVLAAPRATSQEVRPSIARHVTKVEAAASAASAAEKAKKTPKQ